MSQIPVAVEGIAGAVIAFDAGYDTSCAVTEVGALYCWGGNYWGEIGRPPPPAMAASAQLVEGLSGVEQVAGGSDFICALAGSRPYCWGGDYRGELGDGEPATDPLQAHPTPAPVLLCPP